MDNSETYLNMCEQAEEIQGLSPMINYRGQLACQGNDDKGNFGWMFSKDISNAKRRTFRVIWTPRQDQLQDLLRGDGTLSNPRRTAQVLFHSLLFFVERLALENRLRLTSGEQLWLAFVMKQNYGKVWNGEEWVKIPVEVKR